MLIKNIDDLEKMFSNNFNDAYKENFLNELKKFFDNEKENNFENEKKKPNIVKITRNGRITNDEPFYPDFEGNEEYWKTVYNKLRCLEKTESEQAKEYKKLKLENEKLKNEINTLKIKITKNENLKNEINTLKTKVTNLENEKMVIKKANYIITTEYKDLKAKYNELKNIERVIGTLF